MTTYTVKWCGHKYTLKSEEAPTKVWASLFFQILQDVDPKIEITEDYEEDPVN